MTVGVLRDTCVLVTGVLIMVTFWAGSFVNWYLSLNYFLRLRTTYRKFMLQTLSMNDVCVCVCVCVCVFAHALVHVNVQKKTSMRGLIQIDIYWSIRVVSNFYQWRFL